MKFHDLLNFLKGAHPEIESKFNFCTNNIIISEKQEIVLNFIVIKT
jgi:hypothetical protein